jgi:hypothetical protein
MPRLSGESQRTPAIAVRNLGYVGVILKELHRRKRIQTVPLLDGVDYIRASPAEHRKPVAMQDFSMVYKISRRHRAP